MKKQFLLVLICSCFMLTFCKPSKKIKKSNANMIHNKKDSIEVSKMLHNKNAVNNTNSKKSVIQNSSSITDNSATNSTIPTEAVKRAFRTSYPLVIEVSWTKEEPQIKSNNENIRDYKAFFVLNDNKNWVLYADNGSLIETRVQILPEQLPPNILKAIKERYPESYISSSSTFQNIRMKGSYAALIRVKSFSEAIEVVLTDNGTFVK